MKQELYLKFPEENQVDFKLKKGKKKKKMNHYLKTFLIGLACGWAGFCIVMILRVFWG